MKSMKAGGKAMTKGAMTKALATEHGLKQKVCSEVVNSLVAVATQEVKKNGIFTIPGLCRLKTRTKPATKAGVRVMFGKETKVKVSFVICCAVIALLSFLPSLGPLDCTLHIECKRFLLQSPRLLGCTLRKETTCMLKCQHMVVSG